MELRVEAFLFKPMDKDQRLQKFLKEHPTYSPLLPSQIKRMRDTEMKKIQRVEKIKDILSIYHKKGIHGVLSKYDYSRQHITRLVRIYK